MDDALTRDQMLLVGGSLAVAAIAALAVSKLSGSAPVKAAKKAPKAAKKKAKKKPVKKAAAAPAAKAPKKAAKKAAAAAAAAPPAVAEPSKSKKKRNKKKKGGAGDEGGDVAPAASAAAAHGLSEQDKREQRALAKVKKEMAKAAAGGEAAADADADDGWSVAKKPKKAKKPKQAVGGGDENGGNGSNKTAEVEIPGRAIGIIIGPKGATLHSVQDATKTRIDLPQRGESGKRTEGPVIVTISGPTAENVENARRAIEELATKGYCRLTAGDDFNEKKFTVDQEVASELLREKAAKLNKLQDACSIRINVGQRSDEHRIVSVALAGPKDGVKAAYAAVQEIAKFGHSEITHPGFVHVEVAVPADLHRRVIGSQGSEVKHVQNSFKCRVIMPGMHTFSQNVVVAGPPAGVASAEKHIKKIVEDADGERAAAVPEELEEDDWGAPAAGGGSEEWGGAPADDDGADAPSEEWGAGDASGW